MLRDNLSVPSSAVNKYLEDGTDRLSRNIGKELPINPEYEITGEQISSTSRREPEMTHNIK